MEKNHAKIAVVMGSRTDESLVKGALELLERLDVPYELKVLSAHRNPEELRLYAKELEERGFMVVIAVAGMAAHLPGVIASWVSLPVIGVPMATGILDGLDALLSMAQMPRGAPVATMAVGKHGAINAVLLALRILALSQSWAKKALERAHSIVLSG